MGCLRDNCRYKSVKFIEVNDVRLASIYYFIILGIAAYVVAFSIVLSKGYQQFEPVVGTTSIKLKGIASFGSLDTGNLTVYDPQDLQVAEEANSFFVATAFARTTQTQGTCPGDPKPSGDEYCNTTAGITCRRGFASTHGIQTGQCVNTGSAGREACEIVGWCPIEDDTRITVLDGVPDWTAFVKINAVFPLYNVAVSNAYYSLQNNSNLFTLRALVENGGPQKFEEITTVGAIVLVTVDYSCDLDKTQSDQCTPAFSFSRIDNTGSFSNGYNFRYLRTVNETTRILQKVFGVRVLFQLTGAAGKFSAVPLFTQIGAGLGLLGVASLLCDFILQYLHPNKKTLTDKKIEGYSISTFETPIPEEALLAAREDDAYVQHQND